MHVILTASIYTGIFRDGFLSLCYEGKENHPISTELRILAFCSLMVFIARQHTAADARY